MLFKARVALPIAIVLGAASSTSAAVILEASNHSSQYGNPADTPNGPFFHEDTDGAPPAVLHQVPRPRRLLRKHS
jgi:hypothetical protein